jgi:uroporphyrinogen-III synthase
LLGGFSFRAAAVGEATARALREAGVEPYLVAEGGTGAALAAEMAAADPHLAGAPVLLPLAADARPDLAQGLAAAGAAVDAVVAYDKRAPAGTAARARRLFPPGAPLGWVTFTSPRLARTLAELLDQLAGDDPAERWEARRATHRAASIGPTTTATLRRLGVEPAAEAAAPGDADLVAAVVRAAATGR